VNKENRDKIVCHYPLISSPKREEKDSRTLCGEFVRTEHWINGNKAYHMFTIFPEELKCKKCRKLAKGTGMVRYSNSSENPF
jgi:hypothetical protein